MVSCDPLAHVLNPSSKRTFTPCDRRNFTIATAFPIGHPRQRSIPPAVIAPNVGAHVMNTSTLTAVPIETIAIANAEAAWQEKYQPLGPCCEWPRWIGGDPAERWPNPEG